jgi:hypothetical protein
MIAESVWPAGIEDWDEGFGRALAPDSHLGAYEIVALIGAGGMA